MKRLTKFWRNLTGKQVMKSHITFNLNLFSYVIIFSFHLFCSTRVLCCEANLNEITVKPPRVKLSPSPRFLCPTTLYIIARAVELQSAIYTENSWFASPALGSAHFHVSWLSDFINYQKPLYKSLHQSFFYSFITILPSESSVTLHYSTILP